jgi:hypothetical protein
MSRRPSYPPTQIAFVSCHKTFVVAGSRPLPPLCWVMSTVLPRGRCGLAMWTAGARAAMVPGLRAYNIRMLGGVYEGGREKDAYEIIDIP